MIGRAVKFIFNVSVEAPSDCPGHGFGVQIEYFIYFNAFLTIYVGCGFGIAPMIFESRRNISVLNLFAISCALKIAGIN